jgi:uncharacterized membrane protein required for colicin V production
MFDLLFLLVVGLSTGFAVLRGGLQELATLLSLAIAGGLAWIVAPGLIGAFGLSGSFFGMIFVAAFLIGAFFIAAHIGCHLLLKRFPMDKQARRYNQIGGGVFGFARGLILIGLGYLGYSYYLDEARQPDSVKTAVTKPIAAGLASWFESFAPASTDLEGLGADSLGAEPEDAPQDAAQDGYGRAERTSLDEIVTTVTTTDEEPATPDPATPDGETSIEDILQGEDL